MTALDRGEAYNWDTVIEKPYEFPRERPERVPPVDAKVTSWIGDAQALAVLALSAAAQRPDAEALALLEAVPREAWGCGPNLYDYANLAMNAIRTKEPGRYMVTVLDEVGHDGDPWALRDYCDLLSKLWKAFHAATRTLPRETSEPEVKAEVEAPTPEPEANSPRPITFASMAAAFPKLRPAVIDGLLRQGETMNVIAAPKIGKSWLIYDLGLSITTGGQWLDYFQCTPGRVLIIDNELHPETLVNRMPKVAEARRIPAGWESRLDVLSLRGVGLTLDALAPTIRKIMAGQYAAIILDAWYRFIPPGLSENDNAAVMSLYNMLDSYAALTGAAMIAVHHQSKGGQGDKAVTDIGAGAGAQSRAADTHLVLRQHEEDGCIVLEAAVRSFPPVEPLGLRWDFPCWQPAYNLDTEAVQGRRPRHEVQRDEKDRAAFDAILGGLAGGPMSVRDVRRVLGGAGQERAERLLDRLENDGTVIWESVKIHGGTAKVYSLTQPGLEPGLEPGTAA